MAAGGRAYPRITDRKEYGVVSASVPEGRADQFYKTHAGPLRISKQTLELSAHLCIDDKALLEGALKAETVVGPGCLQIYLGLQSAEYNLLGYKSDRDLMIVSYDAARWDVVAKAPSRAYAINIAPEMAATVLPELSRDLLRMRLREGATAEALILPISPQGEALRNMAGHLFEVFNEKAADRIDPLELEWLTEDVVAMCSALMDEILATESLQLSAGEKKRRAIAKEVEAALWVPPLQRGLGTTLDDFAAEHKCSRRQIQLSIQEAFGTGFTEVKRLIRLHQAREQIARSEDYRLTDIAMDYEFFHQGRFSIYYKDFFGAPPSRSR
jgi:AraC-like DNA-binding protein